jgi:hypothetical protein
MLRYHLALTYPNKNTLILQTMKSLVSKMQ